MKRPNRFDYTHGSYGDISFLKQLNKYCSYLENKNKSIQLMQTAVVGQSEQLSKRPNTSSTMECFNKKDKQQK